MSTRKATVTQDWVRGELPQGFAASVVHAVRAAYVEAHQECSEEYGPEGDDLRGYLIRNKVERNIRVACVALPGATVRVELNAAKNSRHVVVRAGRLIITASAVESRYTIVRRAEFRESFAVSNRLWLFDEPEEDRTGKPQYLLILHGPSGVQGEPGFIDLVPPSADFDGYLEEARINLIREIAAVVPTKTAPVEIVAPATPELLPGVATEEDQA